MESQLAASKVAWRAALLAGCSGIAMVGTMDVERVYNLVVVMVVLWGLLMAASKAVVTVVLTDMKKVVQRAEDLVVETVIYLGALKGFPMAQS